MGKLVGKNIGVLLGRSRRYIDLLMLFARLYGMKPALLALKPMPAD